MNAEHRKLIRSIIGTDAERIVFINCAMERGSQDVIHTSALSSIRAAHVLDKRDPSRMDGVVRALRLQPRPDLNLAEAGWDSDDTLPDIDCSTALWGFVFVVRLS